MKLVKFAFVCAAVASLSAFADGEAVSSTLAIMKADNTNGLHSFPVGINFAAADGAVSVSNAVKTASLPEGTLLYVWVDTEKKYAVYEKSGNAWTSSDTHYFDGTTATQIDVPEPNAKKLPAGSGAFIQFPSDADPTQYAVILAGNLPVNPSVTVTPGANLVCAPVAGAFNLTGAAEWSAISNSTFTAKGKLKVPGDLIQVPTADGGASTTYYYNGTAWGTFVNSTFTPGGTIPAGQAFWYIRKGTSNMTISW